MMALDSGFVGSDYGNLVVMQDVYDFV